MSILSLSINKDIFKTKTNGLALKPTLNKKTTYTNKEQTNNEINPNEIDFSTFNIKNIQADGYYIFDDGSIKRLSDKSISYLRSLFKDNNIAKNRTNEDDELLRINTKSITPDGYYFDINGHIQKLSDKSVLFLRRIYQDSSIAEKRIIEEKNEKIEVTSKKSSKQNIFQTVFNLIKVPSYARKTNGVNKAISLGLKQKVELRPNTKTNKQNIFKRVFKLIKTPAYAKRTKNLNTAARLGLKPKVELRQNPKAAKQNIFKRVLKLIKTPAYAKRTNNLKNAANLGIKAKVRKRPATKQPLIKIVYKLIKTPRYGRKFQHKQIAQRLGISPKVESKQVEFKRSKRPVVNLKVDTPSIFSRMLKLVKKSPYEEDIFADNHFPKIFDYQLPQPTNYKKYSRLILK